MATNIPTDVTEDAFPTDTVYNQIDNQVAEKARDHINNQQTLTNYGATCRTTTNQNEYYSQNDSLFNQKLILSKNLESSVDIRYRSHYFPLHGMNAGKPPSPYYVHTVDGEQDIIIKLPPKYTVPENLDGCFLEVALITVLRMNQYYWHVNKFLLHNTDPTILDENPLLIRLTREHLERGEIIIKIILIKTPKSELKTMRSLQLFDSHTSSDWTADCGTLGDLEHTYELSHAKIAFSLGFKKPDGEFVRRANTTVISNEIIEKDKSQPSDVTCPNCSHNFNIKEQKQAGKKRATSSSSSTNKKKNRSE